MAFKTLICFSVIGISHTILSIICALLAESDSKIDWEGKKTSQALVSCIIELVIQGLCFFCFFWAWVLIKRAVVTVLKFHDYLV